MRDRNKQAGFTLVEMAVVILIAGLITGAVFAFYTPYLESRNRQITVDRQEKIARALADFAERQNRLPCPGRTIVTGGVPIGGEVGCFANSSSVYYADGIVPFRALGLTQEDITDGYGNVFTYAVTPYATITSGTGANTAHANCRTAAWIPSPGTTNLNDAKALFCCKDLVNPAAPPAPSEARLYVYNSTNMIQQNYITRIQIGNQDTPMVSPSSPGDFAAPSGFAAVAAQPNDNLAYFAYVLISHGKNGEGAYRIDASPPTARRRPFINASVAEQENADNYITTAPETQDLNFVVLPYSTDNPGSADYFDDIVLWRTQQGVMRELGNNSCSRP